MTQKSNDDGPSISEQFVNHMIDAQERDLLKESMSKNSQLENKLKHFVNSLRNESADKDLYYLDNLNNAAQWLRYTGGEYQLGMALALEKLDKLIRQLID